MLPCSLQHYLQLSRYGNNLSVHQWTSGNIYNRILFSLKDGNPAICNNMEEPEGHYAKCIILDRESKDKC